MPDGSSADEPQEGGYDTREEARLVAAQDKPETTTKRDVGGPPRRLPLVPVAVGDMPDAPVGPELGGEVAAPVLPMARPGRERRGRPKLPGTVRGNIHQVHTTMSESSVELLEANRKADETSSAAVVRALRTSAQQIIDEHKQREEPTGLFAPRPPRRRPRIERARPKLFDFSAEEVADLVELSKQAGMANISALIEQAVVVAYGPRPEL